jgi:hypothetical protein
VADQFPKQASRGQYLVEFIEHFRKIPTEAMMGFAKFGPLTKRAVLKSFDRAFYQAANSFLRSPV